VSFRRVQKTASRKEDDKRRNTLKTRFYSCLKFQQNENSTSGRGTRQSAVGGERRNTSPASGREKQRNASEKRGQTTQQLSGEKGEETKG
jgi:hypothetical protein